MTTTTNLTHRFHLLDAQGGVRAEHQQVQMLDLLVGDMVLDTLYQLTYAILDNANPAGVELVRIERI